MDWLSGQINMTHLVETPVKNEYPAITSDKTVEITFKQMEYIYFSFTHNEELTKQNKVLNKALNRSLGKLDTTYIIIDQQKQIIKLQSETNSILNNKIALEKSDNMKLTFDNERLKNNNRKLTMGLGLVTAAVIIETLILIKK